MNVKNNTCPVCGQTSLLEVSECVCNTLFYSLFESDGRQIEGWIKFKKRFDLDDHAYVFAEKFGKREIADDYNIVVKFKNLADEICNQYLCKISVELIKNVEVDIKEIQDESVS